MGVFSVNDVLRKLGENTIGAVGDVRTMNGAAVRLEDVGKNMTPTATPATSPTGTEPAAVPPADDVAQAWLSSVYARIQRRYENRRKADGKTTATSDDHAYASNQVSELSAALGARLEAAQHQALSLFETDMDPEAAAAAVFQKETA